MSLRGHLTRAVTTLVRFVGQNPQGLPYDTNGNLYVVLGTRSSGATSFVAQIDPTSGAILNQTPNEVALDGLTYDPFNDALYSTSLSGGGVFRITPVSLAIALLPNTTG